MKEKPKISGMGGKRCVEDAPDVCKYYRKGGRGRGGVRPVTSGNLRLSGFKRFAQTRRSSSKFSGENIAPDSSSPDEIKGAEHGR